MARIPECQDLSELGNLASLLEAGYIGSTGFTAVTTGNAYKDIKGNGGNYCLDIPCSNGSQIGTKLFQAPVSEFYWKMHWKQNFVTVADRVLQWQKSLFGGSENEVGSLRVDTQGRFELYVGTTRVLTSINAVIDGHYYLVEVHLKIATAGSGKLELKVNGSSVGWIPEATLATIPATSDLTIDRIYIGLATSNNSSHHYYYDDWDCDTAAYIGESIITPHVVTGNGATIQLTPSAGSNYQNVLEIPPSAAQYNDALAVGQVDTYGVSDLPTNVDTINKVVVAYRIVKAGAAIGSAKGVVRSAGTNYTPGSAHAIPLAEEVHCDIIPTDPATSAAWTRTNFNAAEFGIEFDA